MSNIFQLVLLGPPGSGKGTQAKLLAALLKIPHISTGEIFRENIAQQTALGLQIETLLKRGVLVPDDITNQVVAKRLAQDDAQRGFVLDGYPRSLPQAEFLYALAPETRAVLINLSDAEAVRRIAGRRTCQACEAVYHITFKPSKQAGKCDVCAGELIQRTDQTEEVVRARLAVYHTQTEPVINYYRKMSKLLEVDGSPPIAEVTGLLRSSLGI
jgi:adenylate kinase